MRAVASSLFSAFSFSGRFSTSVTIPPRRVSSSTGSDAAAFADSLIAILRGKTLYLWPLRRARYQLRQLPEVFQFFRLANQLRPARLWQHVDPRAIQRLLLNSKLALALGKLLVNNFAIERHHVRREFFQLL